MKKLMITMIIVASAMMSFGGMCSEPAPCPFGYRLKVMVRTTDTCTKTEGCGPCGEATTVKFRKPSIRRFMGMVYGTTPQVVDGCSKCGDDLTCACNDWSDAKVVLFDYENKLPIKMESAELVQLNRIGCQNEERNKAELTFVFTTNCEDSSADMMFSGFGLCGNHKGNITLGSVQGYCAGLLPAGTVEGCGPCGEQGCVSGNNIWDLCSNTYRECKTTSAYGKWTLVWDSDIASKVGVNLTDTEVKTAWGSATPVKMNDIRN